MLFAALYVPTETGQDLDVCVWRWTVPQKTKRIKQYTSVNTGTKRYIIIIIIIII